MSIEIKLQGEEVALIERALLEYAINHMNNILIVSNLLVKIEEISLPFD